MGQQVDAATRGEKDARGARRRLPLLVALALSAPAAAADKPADPLAGALSVSVKRAREMCFKDQVEVTGTLRIVADGEMDLRAEAPIEDLKKLSVGQKVMITPLGAAPTPGKVRFIAPSVDPASQLGRVRIAIDDGRALFSGVFARGVVQVAERCGTGVPYSSIMYPPDGKIVHVVVDNRVVARRVEIGLLAGTDVEIRSGVTADDLVVTRSGPFLRDGDLVNAIRRDEPAAEASRDRVSRGEAPH